MLVPDHVATLLVEVVDSPAALGEAAGRVLVRSAGRLHVPCTGSMARDPRIGRCSPSSRVAKCAGTNRCGPRRLSNPEVATWWCCIRRLAEIVTCQRPSVSPQQ